MHDHDDARSSRIHRIEKKKLVLVVLVQRLVNSHYYH